MVSIIVKLSLGQSYKSETSVITKFEIVDGVPGPEEMIPIRMYLDCFELSPTYRDLNNMISIRYFIKIDIIDDDDKHYSKQQEIYLWRSVL
jgi:vacuolar protein sorting-associated protein 26